MGLHSGVVAAMSEWEQRFPVSQWVVGGERIWPIARVYYGARLIATGRVAKRPSWTSYAQGELLALKGDVASHRQSAKQRGPCDVIFYSRPSNRTMVDGSWCDRFFDPIADVVESMGKRCVQLEYRPTGASYRWPSLRPFLPVRYRVVRAMVRAGRRFLTSTIDCDLPEFDRFAAEAAAAYPAADPLTRDDLLRRCWTILEVARELGVELESLAPKLALVSPYYSLTGMALCLAASRLGITTVDVQHGVTEQNPAYHGWNDRGSYALVADRYWCWTAEDTQAVGDTAFAGGHPWFAYWDAVRSDDGGVGRRLARIRRSGVSHVLVSLTWSSGLSDLIKKVIAQSPRDWVWWIRLHPLMTTAREGIVRWCRQQRERAVFCAEPTDLPLPAILSSATVHVTHNSTVVQEAARVGVPSVLIDARAVDVYRDALDSGWAVFAETPHEIVSAISAQETGSTTLRRIPTYPPMSDVEDAVRRLLD